MASSSASFSSSSAKKPNILGFFSNVAGNTLQEKMLTALINQLGTIDRVDECLLQNPGLNHVVDSAYGKRLRFRLNTLCNYIARGEKKEAEDFLKANLKNLLPLLKLRTTVKSPEGHILSERTALQIALGAKDVGRDGTDLCLMPLNSDPENTNTKKIFLSNPGDDHASFRYIVDGVEQAIERGTGDDKLNSVYFATLKAMFRNLALQNKPLNLDSEELTEAQQQAYSALLKITEKRKHTLGVNEEGMVQMLHRYLKSMTSASILADGRLLPDGEAEIAKQTEEQFPEGFEKIAEEAAKKDLKELKDVFKAISQSSNDQACSGAIQNFKNYLDRKCAEPLTIGFHFDERLLLNAFALVDEHVKDSNFGGYYGRKADLVFDVVINYIQRFVPANVAMAFAQGVYYQLENGEKLKRDLSLRGSGTSYSSFLSGSGWVDICAGAVGAAVRTRMAARGGVGRGCTSLARVENFFRAKTNLLGSIMPQREKSAEHHSAKRKSMTCASILAQYRPCVIL